MSGTCTATLVGDYYCWFGILASLDIIIYSTHNYTMVLVLDRSHRFGCSGVRTATHREFGTAEPWKNREYTWLAVGRNVSALRSTFPSGTRESNTGTGVPTEWCWPCGSDVFPSSVR
ncbi:hypothetical protein DTO280E4_6308 [Paecilomyces variotii]|nr:hypothetical protein DTO280E4_6308 [Paecilomyces variotii]